jgi:hypothetical protein
MMPSRMHPGVAPVMPRTRGALLLSPKRTSPSSGVGRSLGTTGSSHAAKTGSSHAAKTGYSCSCRRKQQFRDVAGTRGRADRMPVGGRSSGR